MVLARILLPEDFGVVGMLAIIYTVANTLVDAGLGGSLVKEDKLDEIDYSTISTFNILTAGILYFSLFICAGLIESYFQIDGVARIVKLLSLTILIGSFAVVPNAVLLKNLQFKRITIISISSTVVASLIAIVLAFLHFGVYALVLYQIAYSLTQMFLSNWFSKYHIRFGFSLSSLKKLLPFGIFTALITAVDTVYENILVTLTGKYLNTKEAGFVNQSKRIDDGVSYSIAMTIGTVSFPVLTKLKNDKTAFISEAKSVYEHIVLLLLPVLMTVSIFSNEIMILLFGPNWGEAGVYLNGFMFAGVFLVLEALFYGFIKALGVVDKLALMSLIKRSIGIGIIVSVLLLYPRYVIWGYVASSCVGFIVNASLFSKMLSIKRVRIFSDTIKLVIPSLLYFMIMILVRECFFSLWLSVALSFAFILFYYLVVISFYGINVIALIKLHLNKRV